MKTIPMDFPIISIFFLNAVIDKKIVPIVVKRIKKEIFLIRFLAKEDSEKEVRRIELREKQGKPTIKVNMKMISYRIEDEAKEHIKIEEGLFVCRVDESNSREFKAGLPIFKPFRISLTHDTKLGDEICIDWWSKTPWQISEDHQEMPKGINLKKIFF